MFQKKKRAAYYYNHIIGISTTYIYVNITILDYFYVVFIGDNPIIHRLI